MMRKIIDHRHRSQIGFTLIEAVVASSVFVFVVSSVVGVYLSVLQLDNKTRAERTLQQNVRFIFEYLAKGVRNGSINYAQYPGGNTSAVTDQLWFNNLSNENEHIYLNGTDLVLEKTAATTQTTNLNSSNVRVTNLKFFVSPVQNPLTLAKTFNQQPSVTVLLELTSSYGQQANQTSKINIQTTLSSREYPSRQDITAPPPPPPLPPPPPPPPPLAFQVDTGRTLISGLVSYWKLDEASGTRVDSIGTNSLAEENPPVSGIAGIKSSAADFPGVGSRSSEKGLWITDNASVSPGDTNFTFAGWVRFDAVNKNMGIIAKGDTGGTQEYMLFLDNGWGAFGGGSLVWAVNGGSGLNNSASSVQGVAPSAGSWYFVVVWHDSVNNQIGIQVNNGSPVTKSYSSGVIDQSARFFLGKFPDVSDFELDGRIDEVGFWNKVLTAQEKTDLYNGGNGNTLDDGSSPPPDVTSGAAITGSFTFTGLGAGGNIALIDDTNTPAADPSGLNPSTNFRLDFGATNRHIRRLTITKDPTFGVTNPAIMKLEYSDDASSYTQVGTTFTISAGTDTTTQIFDFPASGLHRYWRVPYVSGTTGGNFWLREIEMME